MNETSLAKINDFELPVYLGKLRYLVHRGLIKLISIVVPSRGETAGSGRFVEPVDCSCTEKETPLVWLNFLLPEKNKDQAENSVLGLSKFFGIESHSNQVKSGSISSRSDNKILPLEIAFHCLGRTRTKRKTRF